MEKRKQKFRSTFVGSLAAKVNDVSAAFLLVLFWIFGFVCLYCFCFLFFALQPSIVKSQFNFALFLLATPGHLICSVIPTFRH